MFSSKMGRQRSMILERGGEERVLPCWWDSYHFVGNLKMTKKKKKDKIKNLVSKILPRFYKQMYLWVVFLEMVVTEK